MAEKSHILTMDCIVPPLGRLDAGSGINESEVAPDTWRWLTQRNAIRSLEDIEAEADAAETPTSVESEAPVSDAETDATVKPAERKKK